MANETLTPDGNTRNIAGAVTDDSNAFIKKLRIDDTTKGLKVLVVGGTATGTVNSVTDGTTTVSNPTQIDFSSGAVVTNLGAGVVGVAVTSSLIVGTSTIASGTTTRILYDNAGVLGEYTLTGTGTVVAMATSPTFQTSINGAYLTASQILITDGSSNIISATVATYPSLTELSYVKGVTSAIQTQINAKGAGTVTAVSVATANGVSGSSSGGATPALTISLGAITPSSVNGNTITTGTGTLTLSSYTLTAGATGTVAILGANTFTGAQTFVATVQTVTAMGAQAVNGALGNVFTRTLGASETFTQSGFTTGQCFMIEVKQGSGTSYTVTWFSGITWITSGATAPTQTTTTNGITTYGFRCTGSNTFLGYLVGTQ